MCFFTRRVEYCNFIVNENKNETSEISSHHGAVGFCPHHQSSAKRSVIQQAQNPNVDCYPSIFFQLAWLASVMICANLAINSLSTGVVFESEGVLINADAYLEKK